MITLLLASALAFAAPERPVLQPSAPTECDSARTLKPGESRDCIGTSLPPKQAAFYLADNKWLEVNLATTEAEAADLAEENIRLSAALANAQKKRCEAGCRSALFGGGVVAGGAAVVAVLYAVAPAFD